MIRYPSNWTSHWSYPLYRFRPLYSTRVSNDTTVPIKIATDFSLAKQSISSGIHNKTFRWWSFSNQTRNIFSENLQRYDRIQRRTLSCLLYIYSFSEIKFMLNSFDFLQAFPIHFACSGVGSLICFSETLHSTEMSFSSVARFYVIGAIIFRLFNSRMTIRATE